MVDYIYCTHCDRTSDHGTYNDLVCRRCAGGASDVSVRLWDAVQVVVFIIVSVLLLVLTRPIAVKYFNQNRQKTNVESLIGQQALVLEDVDTLHASGQVKVNGQIWSAKTEEMSGFIAKDTVVMIQGIQGVKLIVKAKED